MHTLPLAQEVVRALEATNQQKMDSAQAYYQHGERDDYNPNSGTTLSQEQHKLNKTEASQETR
jgi:hypothetical protein